MKYSHTWTFILLISTVSFVYPSGSEERQPEKPVNIEWWSLSSGKENDDPLNNFNRQMIAEFVEKYPAININLHPLPNEEFKKQIQLVVQAGNPPDLFQSWGGYVMFEFARQGNLRDITYFVNSTLSKKISRESLGVYSYAGSFYGAPFDMGAVVMWYNKSIFEKAGVSIPETWEDLLSAVEKLKNAGYTPIAMGGKDRWPAHYWWVYLAMRIGGCDAFNTAYGGTGSFKDDAFIEAGRRFQELISMEPFQEGYETASYHKQSEVFGDSKAAMELMGQWAPFSAANNAKTGDALQHIDVFPFPEIEGGNGKITDVMGGGNGYAVGKNAPDEALEFMDYMLSENAQRKLVEVRNIIPVVNSATSGLTGNTAKIADMIANASYYQLYYDQYLPLLVGEALNDASLLLLTGALTPEGTAAMIDDAWQKSK